MTSSTPASPSKKPPSGNCGTLFDRASLRLSRSKVFVLMTLPFLAYFLLFHVPPSPHEEDHHKDCDYIVVIDAGSSGSRAHIFHNNNGVVETEHESYKAKPGLSSYANNPVEAGASLQPLIEFAKERIPEDKVADTPILLKATAGMRLLPDEKRTLVMNHARKSLMNSGFKFAGAKVIPGSEEGLLGWMALNYLTHESNPSEEGFDWAVLEMGGASLQVTVPIAAGSAEEQKVPQELLQSYRSPLNNGEEGKVFTYSFLGLGINAAREAVNSVLESAPTDPCLQKGYLPIDRSPISGVDSAVPAGDFDQCLRLITDTLYPKSECTHESGCFYNGLYKPSTSNIKLWAFENFFYQPSAVGMLQTPRVVPNDLATAAKEVCALSWDEIEANYPKDGQPKEFNNMWCFGLTHVYAFWTVAMGLDPNTQELTIGNEVGETDIDWALGAAINEVAKQEPGGRRQRRRLLQ